MATEHKRELLPRGGLGRDLPSASSGFSTGLLKFNPSQVTAAEQQRASTLGQLVGQNADNAQEQRACISCQAYLGPKHATTVKRTAIPAICEMGDRVRTAGRLLTLSRCHKFQACPAPLAQLCTFDNVVARHGKWPWRLPVGCLERRSIITMQVTMQVHRAGGQLEHLGQPRLGENVPPARICTAIANDLSFPTKATFRVQHCPVFS